jgi:hypothetical protein
VHRLRVRTGDRLDQHRPLGGFLSGTLNFDGEYAGRIMEVGYRETLDELVNLGFGGNASTRASTRL